MMTPVLYTTSYLVATYLSLDESQRLLVSKQAEAAGICGHSDCVGQNLRFALYVDSSFQTTEYNIAVQLIEYTLRNAYCRPFAADVLYCILFILGLRRALDSRLSYTKVSRDESNQMPIQ